MALNFPNEPGNGAEYSAGNGITYVYDATAGLWYVKTSDLIGTNALDDGAVTTPKIDDGAVTPDKLSTGGPNWDTSGNLTTNPGTGWSGTVSQNGAGSAMESGSDVDGNTWIKFADGTMMITTKIYDGNVGGSVIVVNLPQAFANTNYAWFATQSVFHGDANYGKSSAWEGGSRSTTSFQARCEGFTTGGSPIGFTFLVMGRWY